MRIVSNTSPLSNLIFIGEIAWLRQVYPKITIPPMVHTELSRLEKIRPAIASLIQQGWLEIQTPNDVTLKQSLDPGEAEAIALALEIKADRLLIDERLGRQVAARQGLKIRGIVGLLIRAKQQGLIPEVKPVLDRLRSQAGFRVSPALYATALQEAGE